MKTGRIFILACIVVVLIPLLLLPIIVSSGPVLHMITGALNDRLAGTVHIDNLRVGWLDGLEVRQLQYEDSELGVRVEIPQLTCSQGLGALAISLGKNLGVIELEKPVLEVSARPRVTESQPRPSQETKKERGQERQQEQGGKPKRTGKPFWSDLLVKLLLKEGTLRHRNVGGPVRTVVGHVNLDAEMTGGTLDYTLRMASAGEAGWLSSKGRVDLPARRDGFLKALLAQIEVSASKFPLEDILELASATTNLPRGRGTLQGNWVVKTTGIENIAVQGNLDLHDLHLEGGILGKDQPTLKKIQFVLDAQRKGGAEIEVNNLDFNADPGTFQARGVYSATRLEIHGQGELYLPVLFAQFPHLLRLQSGLRIDSGTLRFTMESQRRENRMVLQTNAQLDHLKGVRGKQRIVWDAPLVLDVEAEQMEQQFSLNTLRFRTPFLYLHGQGDLRNFSLNADLDLHKASQEIGSLFKMPWDVSGLLHLASTASTDGTKSFRMTGKMDIKQFAASREGTPIVPKHPLALDWSLQIPSFLDPGRDNNPMNVQVDLDSWLGTTHLVLRDLVKGTGMPSGRFQLTAEAGLGRVTDLLHNLGQMKRGMTLAGELKLAARGAVADDIVTLRGLDLQLADFVLHNHGRIYRDKTIRILLGGSGSQTPGPVAIGKLEVHKRLDTYLKETDGNFILDIPRKILSADTLQVTSSVLRLENTSFRLHDWSRWPETLALHSQGKTDLYLAAELLHGLGILPQDLEFSGTSSFTLALADRKDQGSPVEVAAVLLSPEVKRSGKKIFSDNKVELRLTATGIKYPLDVKGATLHLVSTPLRLQADGSLRAGHEAVLQGEMTPDLAALAPVIEQLTGNAIQMAGRKTGRFQLKIPLGTPAEKRMRQSEVKLDLYAKHIDYLGCRLQELTVPVRLSDGLMHLKLAGDFNGGRLDLPPAIDFRQQPPLMTIPPGTQFLHNVAIQRPLVDGLLKKIHPLFGVLTQPKGSISARFEEFSWPVASKGAQQARFNTIFDVSRIELDSRGVLQELLALAGLENQPLTLKESEITCIGKEGRVTCTPLRILVADSEIKVSGSLGMVDRSLDYLLEIPVTEKLVGREGYRVLAGTTIRVPIRGDADHAFYDQKALSSALSDLMSQAAGKYIEKQAEKILPDLFNNIFGK